MRRTASRLLPFSPLLLIAATLVFLAFYKPQSTFLPSGVPFENPPEIVSVNGTLHATLAPKLTEFEVGGQKVRATIYNGLYMPPVLRVNPGDTIRINLDNELSEKTNLHTHGLNVSPLGNSDNVFNIVSPSQDFEMKIDIPLSHPPGLFWYHPHIHMEAEHDVLSGMSGGLIVNGIRDPLPQELRDAKEQILLLKDIAIDNGQIPDDIDPSDPGIRTVNGLLNPTITIQPGETQFWRIGNIGADKYYKLVLEGHTFYELATDGNRHNKIVTKQVDLIPPSSRSEVFIQGGTPGTYKLKALAFNTGPQGDNYPETTMATLVVKGPAQEPFTIPKNLPPVEDLRNQPIDVHRTIVFSETPDGNTFFVNGQEFGMNRIDTIVKLGSLEEWTIRNISGELHVFHIHQLDFQVTQINGVNQPFIGYQDTINVPVQGRVKVLIPFTDPVIVGKFVYHCHILEHEDKGMMAVIQVRDPANPQLGNDQQIRGVAMPDMHDH